MLKYLSENARRLVFPALLFLIASASGATAILNSPHFMSLVLDTPLGHLYGGTGGAPDLLNAMEFGAKCDNGTDDTTALQAWAHAATAHATMVAPNGCVFKGPLVFPAVDYLTVRGKLIYEGTNTTNTLLSFGASTGAICSGGNSLKIDDLNVQTTTAMTAGDAVYMGHACYADLSGLVIGRGAATLWNGLHVVGGQDSKIRGALIAFASNVGELVHGDSSVPLLNFWQDQVDIFGSRIGLDIAGNVGGFEYKSGQTLDNGGNVLISQDGVALPNKQVFLGTPFIDATQAATYGGTGIGLEIKDPGNSSSTSALIMTGTWLSYAEQQCFKIDSTALNWRITMTGGTVITCRGPEGFDNESTSAGLTTSFAGTEFWDNVGNDILNVSGANPINLASANFDTAAGKISGSVDGAWLGSSGQVSVSSTVALSLKAPNNNILIQPKSGWGVFIGGEASTDCVPVFKAGVAVTGYGNGGAFVTCPYDFGSVALPFNNGFFNNVRGGAYFQDGTPPAASGTCAIKSQSQGVTGGLFQLAANCSGGTVTLTFTAYATTGWGCSAEAMTAADSIHWSGFTTNSASFTITGSANDWFNVGCRGS